MPRKRKNIKRNGKKNKKFIKKNCGNKLPIYENENSGDSDYDSDSDKYQYREINLNNLYDINYTLIQSKSDLSNCSENTQNSIRNITVDDLKNSMERINISDDVILPDGYEQNEQNNENFQEIEVGDRQRIDNDNNNSLTENNQSQLIENNSDSNDISNINSISLTENNQSQSRENNSDSIDESSSIELNLFPFEEKNSEYDGESNDEKSKDTDNDDDFR